LREVFLDDLPRWESGSSYRGIKWKECIGLDIRFIYEEVEGYIKIIDCYENNTNNVLTLNITYKNEPFEILTGNLLKCKFGKILKVKPNYYESSFKYEVDQLVEVKYNNFLRILKQIRGKFYKGDDHKYKGYEYICLGCGCINKTSEGNLIKKQGCPVCRNKIIIKGINDVATTASEYISYFVDINDAYKHSKDSGESVKCKCPECGYIKPMIIRNLTNKNRLGFTCNKCGDGMSYPNKFGFNFLDQIKDLKTIEDFEAEKYYDWLIYEFKGKIRKGSIDFYFSINGKEYGVEMDGGWHNRDNSLSGQTKEESKFIDDEKDRLCAEHNIEIIRINCDKSEMEWIRNNMLQSKLPQLLNFKDIDIDWLKCHEYACSNLVKIVCNLWNKGIRSTIKIGNILKLHSSTMSKYLKQGSELGWCDYDIKKGKLERIKKAQDSNKKKIICLTTGEIFDSQIEAEGKYNICRGNIGRSCKTPQRSAGKHPITNEPLRWQYYDEYIKENPQLLTAK